MKCDLNGGGVWGNEVSFRYSTNLHRFGRQTVLHLKLLENGTANLWDDRTCSVPSLKSRQLGIAKKVYDYVPRILEAYFPRGIWYELWSGLQIVGDSKMIKTEAIQAQIPAYAR